MECVRLLPNTPLFIKGQLLLLKTKEMFSCAAAKHILYMVENEPMKTGILSSAKTCYKMGRSD